LDGGSARRKAASYTGQHKHGISAKNIHASSGIRTHDSSIRAGEDRSKRVGNQNYIHVAKSVSGASYFGIFYLPVSYPRT
jgi:hypothetical protein